MRSERLHSLENREWLETNGLGGWASSTVSGAHSRSYHGLLVAAVNPPGDRRVLLSRLDETLVNGNERIELATRNYPEVTLPQGHRHLVGFLQSPFPQFEYKAGNVHLRKTIAAIHGNNTVVVQYDLLAGDNREPVTLELQPFIAGRDHHSVGRVRNVRSSEIAFRNGVLSVPDFGCAIPFRIILPQEASFDPSPDWYYQFEYGEERARGLASREDLFTPGHFAINMVPGESIAVVISADGSVHDNGLVLLKREMIRRSKLEAMHPDWDKTARTLALAADQFIVQTDKNLRSIIAGYHWFESWGRDTMIALPGLCLVTNRLDDAKSILREFNTLVSEGMIPNRLPDGGSEPEYNTSDASLWYFVAIYRYLEYGGDRDFIYNEIVPTLREILAWHLKGTRYGIKVGTDGLLCAGAPGMQLTWMDARIGKWVVTPRDGKAVEINALWYNAIRILAQLESEFGLDASARKLACRAETVEAAFNELFWDERLGYLYDHVSHAGVNRQIRPNQLFALSLPFPLLSPERGERVLQCVERELLTPRGLRTLSPKDPEYRGRYDGDPLSRDSSYHQGTVWPWLLGPYFSALVKYRGAQGRTQAQQVMSQFIPHLEEAGVGTISEIFDGDSPHTARGCIAQAWSVGEILRSYIEDIRETIPTLRKTEINRRTA